MSAATGTETAVAARPKPRAGRRGAVTGSVGSRRRVAPWMLLGPFLALFALTVLIPVVIAIVQSFTQIHRSGLFGEKGVTSSFAGFANYAQALQNSNFVESLGRVLLFAVVQVPIMTIFATVLALLLESASARWPGFFRAAYFLPYGIPGVIATILWSFLYVPGLSPIVGIGNALGINIDFLGPNTVLWSIANIVTWTYTGYNMLIVVAQLKSIPSEVYEAAKVDGANGFRVAWSIQLPLVRPAILLSVVFSIIGSLQLFVEPQVLQTVSPSITVEYTPNLSAYTNAFAYNDYGIASAEAVIIALGAFILSFGLLALTNRKGRR
ncbi:MAG TPA: sugar ABC transporter permease [Pseudonocardiaceae bacterium]|nr:sugar ABC transporter permease [Pseudonocardiaceae bacterium]